jgi:hypothetical protein
MQNGRKGKYGSFDVEASGFVETPKGPQVFVIFHAYARVFAQWIAADAVTWNDEVKADTFKSLVTA